MPPKPGPDDPAPFAGFYANLIGVNTSTSLVFIVEFSLLALLGIFMYGFYLRERQLKSKIKFTKSGYGATSQVGGAATTLYSQSEVGGTRINNRLSSQNVEPLIK